jgi:hypothetical protein
VDTIICPYALNFKMTSPGAYTLVGGLLARFMGNRGSALTHYLSDLRVPIDNN